MRYDGGEGVEGSAGNAVYELWTPQGLVIGTNPYDAMRFFYHYHMKDVPTNIAENFPTMTGLSSSSNSLQQDGNTYEYLFPIGNPLDGDFSIEETLPLLASDARFLPENIPCVRYGWYWGGGSDYQGYGPQGDTAMMATLITSA